MGHRYVDVMLKVTRRLHRPNASRSRIIPVPARLRALTNVAALAWASVPA
jgi:hypothetical protein